MDGSVNLALNTVQDGLDLMDSLFGPDSTSQTGETFREVWAILSREFTQEGEGGPGGYPALEGMRLLMAYVAIQFATSEQWETIRVRTQCRLVGECLESRDEDEGSSTAWSAVGVWPEAWQGLLTEDEILAEQRTLELREHSEGRHRNASTHVQSFIQANRPASSPNPELTNLLAASYRFSRFCSAMYGSTILELMGAPERYPAHVPDHGQEYSPDAASDHHFHQYTGTPLGSILYSSDTAATVHDGFYSPRYYLLDDVESKQIVLVLRGTKSLHDLMIDLTCDAADLWLDHDTTGSSSIITAANGTQKKRPFKVHGGFLKAARTIAAADTIGIQEKVKDALESRPDYSLLLIGHSLGAGIASILSMLWADPATGLTAETPGHSLSANKGATKANSSSPPFSARSGLGSGVNLGLGLSGVSGVKSLRTEEAEQFYLPGYLPRRTSSSAGSSPVLGGADESSFLPAGRRVRCYAYGAPQVMCPRMSKRAVKVMMDTNRQDKPFALATDFGKPATKTSLCRWNFK